MSFPMTGLIVNLLPHFIHLHIGLGISGISDISKINPLFLEAYTDNIFSDSLSCIFPMMLNAFLLHFGLASKRQGNRTSFRALLRSWDTAFSVGECCLSGHS